MAICCQLPISGQFLHGALFPEGVITFNIAVDTGFQYEEPSVYPAFTDLWLFLETLNQVAVEDDASKARRWSYSRDRRQLTAFPVKFYKPCKINVADTITIGKH